MSVTEAARQVGVSEKSVRKAILRGDLKAGTRQVTRYELAPEHIDQWMKLRATRKAHE